jgi:2-polyprenyl-3-methyl-5-hydroxy-6-metoxy-1,4-benzoquinol methylase
MSTRNQDLEFQDNSERSYSYDFDTIIREYLLERFVAEINPEGNSLELGAYRGDMTQQLLEFVNEITVVEGSDLLASELRARFSSRVHVIASLFEKYSPNTLFDNVFLIHTLEHLDDPIEILSRISKWLNPSGRLFVAVPNANALSRQIAVEMGLIESHAAVTPGEYAHGHRRTYSFDTLLNDLRKADLEVIDFGSVIVKPLANFQFDSALDLGIVDRAYVSACDRLAKIHPDLGSSIFAICEPKHRS